MTRPFDILWPVVGALSILLVWQFALPAMGVPAFIVPTPAAVFGKLWADRALLLANAWPTVLEAVLGFLLGNTVAVLLAILFTYSRPVRAAYFPIVLFLNTIPVLALAPIFILMFGLGLLPKIVIAAVICFFPTLIAMVRGLTLATPTEMELMRVLSASGWETFWRLRAPRSLPMLFTALRIAATGSVIGAIVGEWIGSNAGLGALIIQATFNYQADRLFAAVFIAAAMGLLAFGVVVLVEHLGFRRWVR
ncbi:ABC transporter permease [Inquilinus limosus]|uniref:ABC transporter permease n=1 Tax=Inquilinus limosus TaxID=171674 RepID=UPI0004045674|nr:ABC transporter permease [Inquilinus limosus]